MGIHVGLTLIWHCCSPNIATSLQTIMGSMCHVRYILFHNLKFYSRTLTSFGQLSFVSNASSSKYQGSNLNDHRGLETWLHCWLAHVHTFKVQLPFFENNCPTHLESWFLTKSWAFLITHRKVKLWKDSNSMSNFHWLCL